MNENIFYSNPILEGYKEAQTYFEKSADAVLKTTIDEGHYQGNEHNIDYWGRKQGWEEFSNSVK